MKDVYESSMAARNPPFSSYWKGNSVSIHEGNSRFLAIEMFKFKRSFAPALCKEIITQNRQRYKVGNNANFTLPLVKSIHKGLESLSYFGPKN